MAIPQIGPSAFLLMEQTGAWLLGLPQRSTKTPPFATIGEVSALVPKNVLPISQQTRTISKIALDRLQALKETMLNHFRQGEDQKALEWIQLYQKQIEKMLHTAMTSLGNRPFFTDFKKTLFAHSFELENIKKICEKKGAKKEEIEREFLEQIGQLDLGLPRETQSYLERVEQELLEAFQTKNLAFNAIADHYLHQVGVLQKFLSGATNIIPSFSLYGETEQKMLRHKKSLKTLQSDVLLTMRHLADPTNILREIRDKIHHTLQKLEENKRRAVENLRKALTETSLEDSKDLSDQLQQVNEIYLLGLEEYIKLTKQSLNTLVQQITECLSLSLDSQDHQMQILSTKSKSVIEYLEYESTKILEMAQIFQKPVVSKEYGEKKGVFFSTSDSLVEGRIAKISIGVKDAIESLQVVYVDAEGNEKAGPIFGKSIAHNKTIHLSSLEKVHRVVVSALPLNRSEQSSRIEDIALHVHNHEGRGVHVYKLTGKKSQRQEVEEISFEDSYYLSGIRGYASSEGIHSLSFIFSKDFSSHLKKDLSSKIEAALQVLRQEPACPLTDAEKEQIQQMFMGQVFVELDEAALDPYAVLGLKESASLEEVKKAYHKLARIYHPDKAESYKVGLYRRKFLEISTAYQTLEGKLGGTSAKPNQHSSSPWALS